MSLKRAYRCMHTPVRTQRFHIELRNIPLSVASQLRTSNIGIGWQQKSKRPDRGGMNFREVCKEIAGEMVDAYRQDNLEAIAELVDRITSLPDEFDREAPTNMFGDFNAEAIVNMSHKRLCNKASADTIKVWRKVVEEVAKCDPELARHCVPMCIYRGGICPEWPSCGYISTVPGINALSEYKILFSVTKN